MTFIADERFQSFFVESTGMWTLQIKYVQARDAGIYECQVSTEPKVSARVHLHVVGEFFVSKSFQLCNIMMMMPSQIKILFGSL